MSEPWFCKGLMRGTERRTFKMKRGGGLRYPRNGDGWFLLSCGLPGDSEKDEDEDDDGDDGEQGLEQCLRSG